MAGVNKVILVGNLGADPEARSLNNGGEVVNLRVATSEKWKDRDGKRQERTEWHNVVIFNENLGRVAKSYLRKGSKVYLEGQLQTRKWQDQSGNDRYTTEVVLQKFPRRTGAARQPRRRRRRPRRLQRGLRRRRFRRRRSVTAAVASATGGVRHRPRRRRSFLGVARPASSAWRAPRTGSLLFGQHAGFLERRLGARAARIGIEAKRQRVGDRAAEIDRRAVVEDDVAIRCAELDLVVGPAACGSGTNIISNGSSTWAGDRLAGDDAALVERRDQPALGADHLARRATSVHALRAGRAIGRPSRSAIAPPLGFVGDEVEPLAVADLVEPESVREAVGHSILPSSSAATIGSPRASTRSVLQRLAPSGAAPSVGDAVLIQAVARRLVPVRAAVHRRAPQLRPPGQRADQLAHGLAQRRIAEPEFAMLDFP